MAENQKLQLSLKQVRGHRDELERKCIALEKKLVTMPARNKTGAKLEKHWERQLQALEDTYGSQLRDQAMILEATACEFRPS